MNRFISLLSALGCIIFLGIGSSVAEQERPIPEEEAEDWLENYYKDPTPERFVGEMKNWAKEGTLDNEYARSALIAFLSQVIRANRDSLEDWYGALSGLIPSQKQVLHTAMLFSRTGEADRILREQFGARYDEERKRTHKILEMPLDARPTLDMLWGFFYATGSPQAIRRIVLCFRFVEAPADPEGVDVPAGYVPHFKMLPRSAFVSLVANAERHTRLVRILEAFLEEDKSLLPVEREAVYDVLSEISPERYPPIERE